MDLPVFLAETGAQGAMQVMCHLVKSLVICYIHSRVRKRKLEPPELLAEAEQERAQESWRPHTHSGSFVFPRCL